MRPLPNLSIIAAALSGTIGANAAVVYSSGSQTPARQNVGANVIMYMNCFTPISGLSQGQLELDEVRVGIRRNLTGTGGSLIEVGLRIYAAEMTFDGTNYGLGNSTLIYEGQLGGGAAAVTQLVTATAGTGAFAGDLRLDLETSAISGLGGWWIGVEFTGPNAGNPLNGWRVVNAPTVGSSLNGFGLYDVSTSAWTAFYGIGTPPVLVNPISNSVASRLMVGVDGQLVASPAAVSILCLAAFCAVRRR